MANGALDGDSPAMMVSPSTIVLANVNTITVHTNIPASIVNVKAGLLLRNGLNDVAAKSIYADNLGHIAAKFWVAPLELEPGTAPLTLIGAYIDPRRVNNT